MNKNASTVNDPSTVDASPPGSEALPDAVRPAFLALWEQNQALAARVNLLEEQLAQVGKSSLSWHWLFHPYSSLAVSIAGALALAALVILYRELASGDRTAFFLYYIVPISAPFIAFLLDRAARWREYSVRQMLVDLPVVLLSFARTLYEVPFISGHALFLTYALLTVKSRVIQILTALVLIEVIYLKFFAWHDPTLFGGALLAIMASILVRSFTEAG